MDTQAREQGIMDRVAATIDESNECDYDAVDCADDAEQWQGKEYPDVEWILENLIAAGNVLLFCAPSQAGKTWAGQEWSLCAAAGKDWNGRRAHQCGVAYLSLEGNRRKFQERGAKIMAKHGIRNCPFHPIDGRRLKKKDGSKLVLTIDNLETWVVGLFEKRGWIGEVKLLVIDTLARLTMDYEENDNAAGTRIATILENIAERLGVAVVVLHHTRKNVEYGATALDAGRGNSGIISAIEDKLCLTIHPKNNGRRGKKKVGRFVGDGREWDTPIDEEFTWNYGWDTNEAEEGTAEDGEFQGRRNGGRPTVELTPERMVSLYTKDGQTFTRAKLVKSITANGWAKKTRADEAVTECCEQGYLHKSGSTTRPLYELGERGLELKARACHLDPYGVNTPPPGEMTDEDVRRLAGLYPDAATAEKGLTRDELAKYAKAQFLKDPDFADLFRLGLAARVVAGDGGAKPKYRLTGRALESRRMLDENPERSKPAGAEG